MGIVIFSITFIMGTIYLARHAEVRMHDNNIRSEAEINKAELGANFELLLYDVYPFTKCKSYHNEKLADKLLKEICGSVNTKSDSCLQEIKKGIDWSTIFVFNGVVLFLISFAFLLIAIGAYIFIARVAGACLNLWLGFAHFAAIIVTAVYRFNRRGFFAANCLDHSTSTENS